MKKYKVDIYIYDGDNEAFEIFLEGDDVCALKMDVLPAIQKFCTEHNMNNVMQVEVIMTKGNNKYYDSDEFMFDVMHGKVVD